MFTNDQGRPVNKTTGRRLLVLGCVAVLLILGIDRASAAELNPHQERAKAIFKELI